MVGIALMITLTLIALPARFAVCRLPPEAPIPASDPAASFLSITRTAEELSVVCPEDNIPSGARVEVGWRCFRVGGTLEFSLVGILASLVSPLADAGIPVFAISTFNTDYLLVREHHFDRVVTTLNASGHEVVT